VRPEKKIRVHKCILAARSSFFRNLFASGMKEAQVNEMKIDDMKYEVLIGIISYLYTEWTEVTSEVVIELLIASNRFGLDNFKLYTSKAIARNLDTDNVISILFLARQHEAKHLEIICKYYCVLHFDKLISQPIVKEQNKDEVGNALFELSQEDRQWIRTIYFSELFLDNNVKLNSKKKFDWL